MFQLSTQSTLALVDGSHCSFVCGSLSPPHRAHFSLVLFICAPSSSSTWSIHLLLAIAAHYQPVNSRFCVLLVLESVCLSSPVLLISLPREREQGLLCWQLFGKFQMQMQFRQSAASPTSAPSLSVGYVAFSYLFVSACHEQCCSLALSDFILFHFILPREMHLFLLTKNSHKLADWKERKKKKMILLFNRLTAFFSFLILTGPTGKRGRRGRPGDAGPPGPLVSYL